MRKVVVIVSAVLLVVSVVGAIASLVLNAFVLDDYDSYGEVPIPGSSTLHLPEGDVTVSFHTQVIGRTSGSGLPLPSDLGIGITPPAGVANPQISENIGGTTSVNNDTHVRVWIIHVAQAGDYTVHTKGTVTAYVNPALSFGHNSAYGYVTWVLAGLGGASLVVLLLTIFFWPRTPHAVATDPYVPTDQGVRLQQLKTLASLHDSGALTDEEFETEKRRILEQ
ncbi:MAG: hypothetical protein QOH57_3318 [Mycobacterium sp.]|jgi:hypothetical protein|nr:hypothetical protein [Mycobacterium sp.]